MTIEQFQSEFHLLDPLSVGAVETYHAQSATAEMVMLHFLRGTQSQNAAILERIERLEAEARQKVLRTIEVDGVVAVVTRLILDLTTFEHWLDENAPPADPEPTGAPPDGAEAGEFTRLFTMPAELKPLSGQKAPGPTPARPSASPPASPPPPPPTLPYRPTDPPMWATGPAGPANWGAHHEHERYRDRLAAPPPSASPFAQPRAAPPSPPPVAPAGPSEFTKVIESMPTPNLGPPPSRATSLPAPLPPRSLPPSPGRSKLLLVALLGVVFAAILFVVLLAILP